MSGLNVVLARNTDKAPTSSLSAQTSAFSHYNNLSAQLPVDSSGKLVDGGVAKQAQQCFQNIEAIVKSIGHELTDTIRITIFLKNIKDLEVVDKVYRSFFPTYLPTRTVLAVADLPLEGALLQVEALISCGEGTIPNEPQPGNILKYVSGTKDAPLDPLSSQSVAFSHYNNISAQLPLDPKSNQIITTCVRGQARQCFNNIKAILTNMDVPFDDIVKVNIFLTDLKDKEAVDQIFSMYFPDSGIARAVNYVPARTVVEVAALPMHAKVQVEAVVSHGDGTPPQEVEDRHGLIVEANNTDKAPKVALGTHTVAFSHYNNISAQLPVVPETGDLISDSVSEQTEQCLKNIQAVIESVDHVLEDAVKVNIFLKDMNDLPAVDEVYAKFFPAASAARRVVGVDNLPLGAKIMIDAIFGNAEGTPPIA